MAETRHIYRYRVPIDGRPHDRLLTSSPVAVAAVTDEGRPYVEFWAEHTENTTPTPRCLRVFGTGQPLPDGARWVGTAARTPEGLVWHLYDLGHGSVTT